jgi:hypothetical protein
MMHDSAAPPPAGSAKRALPVPETTFSVAAALSGAPLTYSLRRDGSDFVLLAKPEDAEMLRRRARCGELPVAL